MPSPSLALPSLVGAVMAIFETPRSDSTAGGARYGLGYMCQALRRMRVCDVNVPRNDGA